MKKYNLVIASSLSELITNTNEAIEHGYTPIGGVCVSDGLYIQAICLTTE